MKNFETKVTLEKIKKTKDEIMKQLEESIMSNKILNKNMEE